MYFSCPVRTRCNYPFGRISTANISPCAWQSTGVFVVFVVIYILYLIVTTTGMFVESVLNVLNIDRLNLLVFGDFYG